MNQKQKRKIRQRAAQNRENYLIRRRNWTLGGGPLVIEDDPSREHVKELLLKWVVDHGYNYQIERAGMSENKRRLPGNWTYDADQAMHALSAIMPAAGAPRAGGSYLAGAIAAALTRLGLHDMAEA